MAAASVQCVVTSPPYFGLRDYGVDGQIGLEASPDAYVAEMVAVFREVRRVLADSGCVFLNLGDSYAGSWGARGRGEDTNAARPDLEAKYGTDAGAGPHHRRRAAVRQRGARGGHNEPLGRGGGLMRTVAALALVLVAAAPDPQSEDGQVMAPHSDWITRQKTSGGMFCCSLADGRPVELRQVNGHYEVLYSRAHWAAGTGAWLVVPPEAVLPQTSPLFMPIAWILSGQVRCLALAGAS